MNKIEIECSNNIHLRLIYISSVFFLDIKIHSWVSLNIIDIKLVLVLHNAIPFCTVKIQNLNIVQVQSGLHSRQRRPDQILTGVQHVKFPREKHSQTK